jgi:hypothetical protein
MKMTPNANFAVIFLFKTSGDQYLQCTQCKLGPLSLCWELMGC